MGHTAQSETALVHRLTAQGPWPLDGMPSPVHIRIQALRLLTAESQPCMVLEAYDDGSGWSPTTSLSVVVLIISLDSVQGASFVGLLHTFHGSSRLETCTEKNALVSRRFMFHANADLDMTWAARYPRILSRVKFVTAPVAGVG